MVRSLRIGHRRYVLAPGVNTVGRDPASTVCINDASVSRHHARITISGAAATLEDLKSKNGTQVMGERIDAPSPLWEGALVEFANFMGWFIVEAGDEESAGMANIDIGGDKTVHVSHCQRRGEFIDTDPQGGGIRRPGVTLTAGLVGLVQPQQNDPVRQVTIGVAGLWYGHREAHLILIGGKHQLVSGRAGGELAPQPRRGILGLTQFGPELPVPLASEPGDVLSTIFYFYR